MSVVLARRMVSEGVVTPEEVNAALLTHVTERAAFLEVLVRAHPGLVGRLETELGCSRRDESIVPDATLMNALPKGLAKALLVIAVGRDPGTNVIHVVAADSADPHLANELAHHFGERVRVSSAPLGALLAAFSPPARPVAPQNGSRSVDARLTPAFGVATRGPPPKPPRANGNAADAEEKDDPDAAFRPSEPPIPLVRLSVEGTHAPTTVKGVAPQATGAAHATRVVVPPRAPSQSAAEPVIELTRAKQPSVVVHRAELEAAEAPRAVPAASMDALPESGQRESVSVEAATREFDEATNAEGVVAALVRGLSAVAARVVVLAARGKVYEGRDTNEASTLAEVRALVVSGDRPSVLQSAAQNGSYVGPMPRTLVHEQLAHLLGDPLDEIVVGVVSVSGRAALIYVIAGVETTYLATRAADQLATAAAHALERVLRQRKR